ncbi:hypothetical protein PM10SUCC1_09160 [Propionigenium maris DSM 9537]|uniref:ADP-ribose pyrophosphatase YjhB, NUDIX family n=1 Tax=Propionigenium maris DSM 9537 TaxID=1123000 RepID=A0A9W6GJR3_9FUSO|nr:hypothetical protein [Propionigenium maris]GLI55402.1 hypothetical protein PM10SUCC1_09160 [Propionigenium maris DSM 9537]
MRDKFSVAVKGVLCHEGRYLLRKNQRDEFELLGGKLETTDTSMEERLVEEFLEESGIAIQVDSSMEPWLYTVGSKNIIIVPFICSAVSIPETLFDEDGGELLWVSAEEVDSLNMPYGYLDTIHNRVPRKSTSPFEGKYLKIIPNYVENTYEVVVRVRDGDNNLIVDEALDNFTAPREHIERYVGEIEVVSELNIFIDSKLYINYLLK